MSNKVSPLEETAQTKMWRQGEFILFSEVLGPRVCRGR